jgi:L,D-transpeptidase catalytic domain
MRPWMRHAITGLLGLVAISAADTVSAARDRAGPPFEAVASREAGEPLMAIVSLGNQRVTVYDATGWILRASVSSGHRGYETPAGIFSVLQKEEEHYSNLYDDASMPFMQRITWSGIALHAGQLPGYPASHGCIRMPYEFARYLYDMTKIGMRVIVAQSDVHPAEIDHPLLFKPKLVRAGLPLEALAAHWDLPRASADSSALEVSKPEAAVPLSTDPAEPLVSLKSVAAAKSAAAAAAAKKTFQARMTAAKLAMEEARTLHAAEAAKYRAEAQLRAAEGAIENARAPEAVEAAEAAKSEALAKLADAERRLAAAKSDAPVGADAVLHAREEVRAAEAEKMAASKEAEAVERLLSPVSVFISRKTQRLYVRQDFQPVLEMPVTIRDAGDPIGTHIYTALDYANGGAGLRWSAVSLDGRGADQSGKPNRKGGHAAMAEEGTDTARTALDRIEIPRDAADRIAEVISPGSSLIISDEGMSAETGKDTDFVVLLSSAPQGGLKIRRRNPEEAQWGRWYERPNPEPQYGRWYGRPPVYYPPSYGRPGGPFGPW